MGYFKIIRRIVLELNRIILFSVKKIISYIYKNTYIKDFLEIKIISYKLYTKKI
jgi:hypothetical protein